MLAEDLAQRWLAQSEAFGSGMVNVTRVDEVTGTCEDTELSFERVLPKKEVEYSRLLVAFASPIGVSHSELWKQRKRQYEAAKRRSTRKMLWRVFRTDKCT